MIQLKIIDKYILVSYLRRLFITFFVLMLIFFFHTIWLFIQELAGKDVGIISILKFLLYYTPNLTYITLPLAVIVASIMTFGSLAENYEFVAIKSSGISVSRAMRSLTVVMIILSGFAFYVANNLIPIAEYKNYKFQYNISRAQPALAITEGVFSNLGTFNIKVDEKYGDNNQYLKNVIIHEIDDKSGKNTVVIKSKTGELISDETKDFIQLILYDGNYYEEIENKKNTRNFPHLKAKFETYTINMDLSYLGADEFDDTKMVSTFRMMTSAQLNQSIDSLKQNYKIKIKTFSSEIYRRTSISNLDLALIEGKDTIYLQTTTIDDMLNKLDLKDKMQLIEMTISNAEGIFHSIENKITQMNIRRRNITRHIISYHDKFSLALACIILFFTGAPLGAIIKKGGIGMPMVFAIVLFLTYYFVGMLAKNIAESGGMNPVLSSWLSDILILPLGVIFIYRAAADKSFIKINKIRNILYLFKKKK